MNRIDEENEPFGDVLKEVQRWLQIIEKTMVEQFLLGAPFTTDSSLQAEVPVFKAIYRAGFLAHQYAPRYPTKCLSPANPVPAQTKGLRAPAAGKQQKAQF